jgi:hypothetical protein
VEEHEKVQSGINVIKYCPEMTGGTEENHRILSVPSEIRTGNLLNASQRRYR